MRVPYRKPGKYSQMKSDPFMTKEKFAELEEKLEKLKEKRPQAAAEVKRLAELGDFSENVEYQLAKGRLRGINNAILTLESQLNQAEIIEVAKNDKVRVGGTVTVQTENGLRKYKILGSAEADPAKGIISRNSPIGEALLGHRVGEAVRIKLADRMLEYLIKAIE
jgi:transcription elongation factor GreA